MITVKAKLSAFVNENIVKIEDCDRLEKEALKAQISIEQMLLEKKICSEEVIYKTLAKFYEMPFSHIDLFEIDKNLIEQFGLPFLKKLKFVPIKVNHNNTLIVACSDRLPYITLNAIKAIFSGPCSAIMIMPSELDLYLSSLAALKSTDSVLNEMENRETKVKEEKAAEAEVQEINAPAVRLVDSIINEAIPFRASDIHIEPAEENVVVRYRIDGDLVERIKFSKTQYDAVCARIKIISGMNIAERRIPQDGRINMQIGGVEYDFRLSTLPTVYGEKFVIRVLDKTSFSLTRKELGFREDANAIIDKILSHPHGLVLLTGPTGCGKSTSLYCFLKEVNKSNVNIVTVEDPVEYSMDGINQIQVNPKADLTFANALRSILRQDPDIIMVGEIRDEETAHMAIRGAITGHLVFSTLHTNDCTGAVARLTDMGVDAYLVSDALVGVISQRLIKKLCPFCKKQKKTSASENELLGLNSSVKIYEPKGCKFCNFTGYKGRRAVHEILYINDKIRASINQKADAEALRAVARKNGLIELFESCKMCVLDGETSIAELMSINSDIE